MGNASNTHQTSLVKSIILKKSVCFPIVNVIGLPHKIVVLNLKVIFLVKIWIHNTANYLRLATQLMIRQALLVKRSITLSLARHTTTIKINVKRRQCNVIMKLDLVPLELSELPIHATR